ncbi:MAG: glutathione S-transferase family protein [Pseudomonadota bacterium]
MTYELYCISGSPNSWRAALAMEVKGLNYVSHRLDPSKREHKTPEYLAMNPRGKVPVLKDGDTIIYESLAIVAYLDAKHAEPPLFGTTPAETGRVWQVVSELIHYTIEPMFALTRIFYRGQEAEKADEIKSLGEDIHVEFAEIEKRLAGRQYLAGDTLTAADILLYPALPSLIRGIDRKAAAPFDLGFLPLDERYPGLAAWAARIEGLPGFERTYPPHWRQ